MHILYNLMNQFTELNSQPPIDTATSFFDVYFTRHYVAALSLCRLTAFVYALLLFFDWLSCGNFH